MSGHKAPDSHKRKSDAESGSSSSSTALVPTAPKRPKTTGPDFVDDDRPKTLADAFSSRKCNPLLDALIADLIGMIWEYLNTVRGFQYDSEFPCKTGDEWTRSFDFEKQVVYSHTPTNNRLDWFSEFGLRNGRGGTYPIYVGSRQAFCFCPVLRVMLFWAKDGSIWTSKFPNMDESTHKHKMVDTVRCVRLEEALLPVNCRHEPSGDIDSMSGKIVIYSELQDRDEYEHALVVLIPSETREYVKIKKRIRNSLWIESVVIRGDYVYVAADDGFKIYKVNVKDTKLEFMNDVVIPDRVSDVRLLGFYRGCVLIKNNKNLFVVDAITGEVFQRTALCTYYVSRVDCDGKFCWVDGDGIGYIQKLM